MERTVELPHLRLVREPEQLEAYFRPHGRDIGHLCDLVAADCPIGTGVVIDGRHITHTRAADLFNALRSTRKEIVLDAMGPELWSHHAYSQQRINELPWAIRRPVGSKPHTDAEIRQMSEQLAEVAIRTRSTSVLAPVSFHAHTPLDSLPRDADVTLALRAALDAAGGKTVAISYPVVAPLKLLSAETARARYVASLRTLAERGAIDDVWLRVAAFDAHRRSAANLRAYVCIARRFHSVGVPIISERANSVGLAALATGAVVGVSSTLTVGEPYDSKLLQKRSAKGGRLPGHRVYLGDLGVFVEAADAERFLKHRTTKNWFVCQRSCCGGVADMLTQPRKHFLVSRTQEVQELALVPAEHRAAQYRDSKLRVAAEHARLAVKVDPEFQSEANRVCGWHEVFTAVVTEDSIVAPSRSPLRRSRTEGSTRIIPGTMKVSERPEWLQR